MPADHIELEQRTLSAVWKDRRDILRAVDEGLAAEHFTDPRCRGWFTAALAGARAQHDLPPCESVVFDLIKRRASSEERLAVFEVDRLEPTSARACDYVDELVGAHRAANARAVLAAAQSRLASEGPSALAEIQAEVVKATKPTAAKTPAQTLATASAACLAELDNPQPRVSTGFDAFDRVATPIGKHEVVVIGGRTGTGKSALALQIARHVVKRAPVAFFSLEMSASEIAGRCAIQALGADGAGDHPRAVAARRAWFERQRRVTDKLRIFDSPPIGSDFIARECEAMAGRADGLGLVVVDYLQLLAVPAGMKAVSREQQVAAASRDLKLLALRIGVPILLLSQLSRDVEKDGREPRLSDLRESGAIEQDADRVWFVFEASPDAPNEIVLVQRKCRGGPQGVGKRLHFNRPCVTFTEA